jgi:hypothetical protein
VWLLTELFILIGDAYLQHLLNTLTVISLWLNLFNVVLSLLFCCYYNSFLLSLNPFEVAFLALNQGLIIMKCLRDTWNTHKSICIWYIVRTFVNLQCTPSTIKKKKIKSPQNLIHVFSSYNSEWTHVNVILSDNLCVNLSLSNNSCTI